MKKMSEAERKEKERIKKLVKVINTSIDHYPEQWSLQIQTTTREQKEHPKQSEEEIMNNSYKTLQNLGFLPF